MIIDTSLLVAAERGRAQLDVVLGALRPEPVGIAAITASELLFGCLRARDAGVRSRRAAFIEALFERIPVLPFGLSEARQHAQLWLDLSRAGMVIGPHDLLIAATALARGEALATLNQREFSRVAGLRLVALDSFLS